ncbi:hypothetical protein Adt_34187 [Abeliophyllum distichum]|uniref:Uncharacterized protein n=1 Tax=Abeliophyllum distichum TaxID=126358 RepID=A0ABD1QYD7_9LAMI
MSIGELVRSEVMWREILRQRMFDFRMGQIFTEILWEFVLEVDLLALRICIHHVNPQTAPCSSTSRTGTAALLADAAMRIHKHKSKPKTQIKNVGFGLFGSILKRLKDRNKNKKRAIGVKNETNLEEEGKMDAEIRISCSCNNSRLSSAGWSEYNEEKYMDLETSTSSCRSEYSEIINDSIISRENRFCVSPFRFSLQTSPSLSGHLTPDFCSPSASPNRHKKQENEKNPNKVEEEVAEEKEQCSPVSVLDPPFEDEEDEHESGDANEDDYDLECSYANVQRTKQQLLYRLRRFEKLAELDPMELERKLLEESDDDDDDLQEIEELEDEEPLALYKERRVENFVTEVFNKLILKTRGRFPLT